MCPRGCGPGRWYQGDKQLRGPPSTGPAGWPPTSLCPYLGQGCGEGPWDPTVPNTCRLQSHKGIKRQQTPTLAWAVRETESHSSRAQRPRGQRMWLDPERAMMESEDLPAPPLPPTPAWRREQGALISPGVLASNLFLLSSQSLPSLLPAAPGGERGLIPISQGGKLRAKEGNEGQRPVKRSSQGLASKPPKNPS